KSAAYGDHSEEVRPACVGLPVCRHLPGCPTRRPSGSSAPLWSASRRRRGTSGRCSRAVGTRTGNGSTAKTGQASENAAPERLGPQARTR
ncbi:unnamed protein product, partial [Ectocarpus sp. 13 AM-2016]